jgi:hypothetical protein
MDFGLSLAYIHTDVRVTADYPPRDIVYLASIYIERYIVFDNYSAFSSDHGSVVFEKIGWQVAKIIYRGRRFRARPIYDHWRWRGK